MLNTAQRHSWGVTVLRVIVGIVFLAHGLQKFFEMGLEGVSGFFGSVGIPAPFVAAALVTAVETFCGLALILGFYTRWAVIPLALTMLVAILTVHLPKGFFVAQGGYELALLLLGANIALGLLGSGAFSLDEVIARMRGGSQAMRAAEQGS